ncbi:CPBP family intramembrane glutamic endopeptidase [Cutibacterium granulosum]|uniref:CPBP family intramembrane glutamic endopeptidase n=1 Tax=Cutibacterium granulosum TaxID=33011 RepID=UPI0025733951|nr:type II CAAX endopeptidase family protein [Cutibacterium granulosum]MDU1523600.1 type II CAAX endopeptidase family protein [Cutibacterium granulosum]MDU7728498.1 type II CAAX endopeptidase family protein [Cutibacterium granulosum]BDQ39689.1 hypothetical protein TPCG7_03380 [Cutibacterium granulosum]
MSTSPSNQPSPQTSSPGEARDITYCDAFLAHASRLPPMIVVVASLVILAVGQLIVSMPATALLGTNPAPRTSSVVVLLSFWGVWLALWAWMRFVDGRPMRALGLEGRRTEVWIGLVIALVVLGGDLVVMTAAGQGRLHWAHPHPAQIWQVLGLAVLFVIQGSAEEVVLRGHLMQTVAARWGIIAGVSIQAVLFAVLHSANPGVSVVAVVNIALFGLMLGVLVLWRGSLWPAVGFHGVWNWLQGPVLGFDVSGMDFGQTILRQTHPAAASTLWTGGSFGAEAALPTTVFLVVVTSLLIVVWRSGKMPGRPAHLSN